MRPLDRIGNVKISQSKRRSEPLWKGPEVDGITQSMLGRFLVCRERFRLMVVDGLKAGGGWNHRLGYGDMWHVCEESLAGTNDPGMVLPHRSEWEGPLEGYTKKQLSQYPLQREEILKWHTVCLIQFPIYVDYWRKHHDVENRTPLLQEEVFDLPYHLPSGRKVRLRGKWDSVDLIKEGKKQYIYLQENKTKGDVDQRLLARQLTFDLQTMFYLVALTESEEIRIASTCVGSDISNGNRFKRIRDSEGKVPAIKGVRYNVVRRPLSGGKGNIKPHQAKGKKPAETMDHYYERLAEVIREDADTFFMRWKAVVTPQEIETFRVQFLDPILDQLCVWWDWITTNTCNAEDAAKSIHWRFPYGVYNPMMEGKSSELDEYLHSGSTSGLVKVDTLYPELGGDT